MNQKEKDFCFKLFTLTSSPTVGELKKKYRELLQIYHPDKHPENIEKATRMVQQLNEAYEILLANLCSIFSNNLDLDFNKKTKMAPARDSNEIIVLGDDALRDAVIIGWLKRAPKDSFARNIRKTVEKSLAMLIAYDSKQRNPRKIIFYIDLFSAFLQVTAQRKPRPLPEVFNTTQFFHYLRNANKYLDSGIRNYYRFTENGKKLTHVNIPLSFLIDAIQLFLRLKDKIHDTELIEQIQAKIELAELFRLRIQNPDFALV